MTTHQKNDHGLPTVVDLGTRPAANAVPTVSVRRSRSGRWTIFEVEGEMDLQVVPLVADLSGLDGARVVFELHGVTFMDAGGLGAMMKSRRRAVHAGGCVRLVAPSSQVRRLLMLTGSDRVFLMFDSINEAVSAPGDASPKPA